MMILLVAIAAGLILGRITVGPCFFLIAFPGVLMHELSHAFTAGLLGGHPEPMNLVPKKDANGGWTLGSVIFYPTWWNAGFVALAPMYILPAVAWALYSHLANGTLTEVLVGGYLIACLVWGSIPSRADWNIALTRPAGTVVVLLGMYAAITTMVEARIAIQP